MDSSSLNERTATTVTSGTSRPVRRPAADTMHALCWCGQDTAAVRGGHCPRCGTLRGTQAGAALPRLAA